MGFVVGLIGIMLIFIDILMRRRKCFIPVILFNALWSVLCILSELRLYNLLPVSNLVYIIVLIGMLFFDVGFFWGERITISLGLRQNERQYKINKIPLYFSFVFCFVILLFLDYQVVLLVMSGIPFAQVRYTQLIFSWYFINAVYKFIVFPMLISIVILFVSDTCLNKRIEKKYLAMSGILTVMDVFAVSDRLVLFIWIIGIVGLLLVLKDNIPQKLKKKLKKVVLIFSLAFLLIIILRGGNILSSIYMYSVGGLVFFSKHIDAIRLEEMTVFASSFQGLLRPIMGILELAEVRWDLFEEATNFLMSLQRNARVITYDGRYFNYFTTAFAYFYKDYRMLGVIIISFLWGFISGNCYKMFQKHITYHNVAHFLFVIISIVLSVMNFMFVEVGMVWGMIYYHLLFISKKHVLDSK